MYVYTGRCRPVSSNVVRSVNTAYDYAWRLIQASGRILNKASLTACRVLSRST